MAPVDESAEHSPTRKLRYYRTFLVLRISEAATKTFHCLRETVRGLLMDHNFGCVFGSDHSRNTLDRAPHRQPAFYNARTF